jgi:hypothetical protein
VAEGKYRIYLHFSLQVSRRSLRTVYHCGNLVFTLLNIDTTTPCPKAKLSPAKRPGTVPSLSLNDYFFITWVPSFCMLNLSPFFYCLLSQNIPWSLVVILQLPACRQSAYLPTACLNACRLRACRMPAGLPPAECRRACRLPNAGGPAT